MASSVVATAAPTPRQAPELGTSIWVPWAAMDFRVGEGIFETFFFLSSLIDGL